MKRKDFLKRLGIGLGVAIVAPKVLAEMPANEETTITWVEAGKPPPLWTSNFKWSYYPNEVVEGWKSGDSSLYYKPRRISYLEILCKY